MSAVDPLIGQVLAERWALTSMLGAGAMGTVYQAVDRAGGEDVAVKVLRPADARFASQRQSLVRRFRREARVMKAIRHPGAIRIIDFGEDTGHGTDGGVLFLVMELVCGEPLEEALERQGALAPLRVAGIGAQIADALAAAHAAGVVHRDLKPANVFVCAGDRVKVGDFGIARLTLSDAEVTRITKTGHTLGSPHYMSPEQAMAQPIDHTTDLYALGVVLYELLTGHRPFQAESFVDIAMKHVAEPPPPLGVPGLDEDTADRWAALVGRLLEKSAAARPQEASRVASALRSLGPPAAGGPALRLGLDPRHRDGADPRPADPALPLQGAHRRRPRASTPAVWSALALARRRRGGGRRRGLGRGHRLDHHDAGGRDRSPRGRRRRGVRRRPRGRVRCPGARAGADRRRHVADGAPRPRHRAGGRAGVPRRRAPVHHAL